MYYKKNKYRAVKSKSILIPDRSFPSKLERDVATHLQSRQINGEISDLKFQQSVDLVAGIRWKIDFSYVENDKLIYHEAKGMETEDYKLKKKLYKVFGKHELRISKRIKFFHAIVEIIQPSPVL